MRLFRLAIIAAFVLPLFASACSGGNNGGDNDPFATFQDCYNEHHVTEGFDTQKAIEICCISHPIGSAAMNVVCGDTAMSCETYVTGHLTDGSDQMLSSDITAACTKYVTDRSM